MTLSLGCFRLRTSREADVGSQSIDTIKSNFKESKAQQTLTHSR